MSLRGAVITIAALGLVVGGWLFFYRQPANDVATVETHDQTVPIVEAPVDEKLADFFVLTNVGTFALPHGTYRPELLAATDGTFYVVVVEPKGESRHWAYHYDADWKLIGQPFAVSAITEEYGESADHRAMLFGDELVVIYQSRGASDQSLILARFTLDGQLVKRLPIIANAANGTGEDFSEPAITWFNNHITITTGTGEQKLKIRQIDVDGNVVSTEVYPVAAGSAVSNEIGNSLFVDANGNLNLVSGNEPTSTESLVITTFDSLGEISASLRLPTNGREETFPADNTGASGYEFIAYISGVDPYLKILDAESHVLADVQIGQGGFMYVHPTVAVSGGHVFVAWSKNVDGQSQVQIEELTIASD